MGQFQMELLHVLFVFEKPQRKYIRPVLVSSLKSLNMLQDKSPEILRF